MNETHNIVNNILEMHVEGYGYNHLRDVKVKCIAKFLDKVVNEIKYITIERYNIIGEVNKILQSSHGL